MLKLETFKCTALTDLQNQVNSLFATLEARGVDDNTINTTYSIYNIREKIEYVAFVEYRQG